MLNHASYGLPTRDLLARAEEIRRELDADPNVELSDAQLQERLDAALAVVCGNLGLNPAHAALASSATACAAAVEQSLQLTRGDVVLALDCEYSSILRGWRHRCEQVGAELRVVRVALPFLDVETLLAQLDDAAGADRVAVLQFSAVTSSAALQLPVSELAAWGHKRGAVVVVDAAHAPGHVDVTGWEGVDVAFGTIHKWFPVPRSVGIIWATPGLVDLIRPAEVSLSWDEPRLARRFGWPGTFDPAARLTVPDAVSAHADWALAGELARCEQLADLGSDALSGIGAIPTAGPGLRPPRMRAFLLDGVQLELLRQRLLAADIRAWTGSHGDQGSLLRIATNVYTDESDIDVLTRQVEALLDGRTTS